MTARATVRWIRRYYNVGRVVAGKEGRARSRSVIARSPASRSALLAREQSLKQRGSSVLNSHRRRTAGYDAIDPKSKRRLSIKGRCILPGRRPGQRIGRIDIKKGVRRGLACSDGRRFQRDVSVGITQGSRDRCDLNARIQGPQMNAELSAFQSSRR